MLFRYGSYDGSLTTQSIQLSFDYYWIKLTTVSFEDNNEDDSFITIWLDILFRSLKKMVTKWLFTRCLI